MSARGNDRGGRLARQRLLSAGHAILILLILVPSVPGAAPAAEDARTATAEPVHSFDIPAQNLVPALQAWAAVTGRDWVHIGGRLTGITSPGVSGVLDSREALERLLTGTGFDYVLLPDGAVSIVRAGRVAPRGDPGTDGAANAAAFPLRV